MNNSLFIGMFLFIWAVLVLFYLVAFSTDAKDPKVCPVGYTRYYNQGEPVCFPSSFVPVSPQ